MHWKLQAASCKASTRNNLCWFFLLGSADKSSFVPPVNILFSTLTQCTVCKIVLFGQTAISSYRSHAQCLVAKHWKGSPCTSNTYGWNGLISICHQGLLHDLWFKACKQADNFRCRNPIGQGISGTLEYMYAYSSLREGRGGCLNVHKGYILHLQWSQTFSPL